jgi:hypothetical protein
MRAGLLTIDAVLSAAEEGYATAEDKREWYKWLTVSGDWGKFAATQFPDLFKSIRSTGVSVVALLGRTYFHTQYYSPQKREATRRSTRIPIDLKPPVSVQEEPLWWWESKDYLKILKAVRRAAQERFAAYESWMVEREAGRAAASAAQASQVCVEFVSDWIREDELRHSSRGASGVMDAPAEALEKCSATFAEFGIDLPKLLWKLGVPSERNWKLGVEVLDIQADLLGAAADRLVKE